MESGRVEKILIINLGGIGDLLLSTPALRGLKERFPEAKLYLLAVGRTAEVARDLVYLDGVFIFEIDHPGLKMFSNLGSVLKLRKLKVDLAINMRTLVSGAGAAKMAWIMDLISPRIKAGRDTAGRGYFLDIKIPEEDLGEKYEMDHDIETVRAFGAKITDRKIDLVITPESLKSVEDIFKSQGINPTDILIGIHPGGKPSHRWPKENFVEVIKGIAQENPLFKYVITGSPDEVELAEQIIAKTGIKFVNLAGKLNIQELAAVLKRCSLYITNDTGSMHIAAIMKTPLVAIFGPGYLKRFDPRNIFPEAVVFYNKAACAPCNRFSCSSMECFKAISPMGVGEEARRLLGKGTGHAQ